MGRGTPHSYLPSPPDLPLPPHISIRTHAHTITNTNTQPPTAAAATIAVPPPLSARKGAAAGPAPRPTMGGGRCMGLVYQLRAALAPTRADARGGECGRIGAPHEQGGCVGGKQGDTPRAGLPDTLCRRGRLPGGRRRAAGRSCMRSVANHLGGCCASRTRESIAECGRASPRGVAMLTSTGWLLPRAAVFGCKRSGAAR